MMPSPLATKRRPRKADVARYCERQKKSRAALDAVAVVAVSRLCRLAVRRRQQGESAAAPAA